MRLIYKARLQMSSCILGSLSAIMSGRSSSGIRRQTE